MALVTVSDQHRSNPGFKERQLFGRGDVSRFVGCCNRRGGSDQQQHQQTLQESMHQQFPEGD
jgi:hypothetical protein